MPQCLNYVENPGPQALTSPKTNPELLALYSHLYGYFPTPIYTPTTTRIPLTGPPKRVPPFSETPILQAQEQLQSSAPGPRCVGRIQRRSQALGVVLQRALRHVAQPRLGFRV